MFEFDVNGLRECVHDADLDDNDDADYDNEDDADHDDYDDVDDDDDDDYDDVPGDSEGEPYGLEEVRGLEEEP